MTRPTIPFPAAHQQPLTSELQQLRAELQALRRDNEELRRALERYEPRVVAALGDPALSRVAVGLEAVPARAAEANPRPSSDSVDPGALAAGTGGFRPASFSPPELPGGMLAAPQQGLDFGAVARLTPDKLDSLPYGLITLDARGRVIYYNDTESRLVGLPKDRVIGKSFFREVAPCTRIRDFEGRFVDLAANPTEVRVQSFDFVFKFARGEQHVSVVMTPARVRGQFHLALLRRQRDGG